MKGIKRWIIILIVTPLAAVAGWWSLLFFGIYFVQPIQNWNHQAFASEETPKIEVARQIDEIFGHSNRYITYDGNFNPEWNSHLFLYGRYELLLQVPVKIISAKNVTVTGQPIFRLSEINKITTNNGIVGVSYTNGRTFGQKDWDKIYKAKGDFKSIGFELKTNAAVENIDAYMKASR
jgi:hypothetical protein